MQIMSFSKTYITDRPRTMEEIQAEIDALTHSEFTRRLVMWLGHIGCIGAVPYYAGGTVTPNAMITRAFANRLARTTDDPVGNGATIRQDFMNFDAQQKKEAQEAKDATPPIPALLWIDADSYKKLVAELSITRALLTTYHVSGCVALRTVSKEEMREIAGQEL